MNFISFATEATDAWSMDLIRKYDVPGPRYTSYPTAPNFSEAFGEAEYALAATANRDTSIAPLSLYVHVPFCRSICYYCACNKVVTKDPQAARQYLDYLHKEMDLQAKLYSKRRQVMQLHLGGGTPTFLSHAELTELMHMLATHFRLVDNPGREYSIEIDPRTITIETLALLKGLGFNRLSFGIQDFDPKVQQAINRIESFDSVKHLTEAARHYGFKSISYDLIYGLPFQSETSLQATLDKVLELSPDRIACYNYAHLPERFSSQRAIDRLALPTPEQKLAMMAQISTTLIEHDYHYIGMDHFVKAGDDLEQAQRSGKLQRNFQGYSTCMAPDLVGMGVSAITSLTSCYAQNEKTLDDYYRRLDNDEIPVQRGYLLNQDDKIRGHVIMELACNLKLDLRDFYERFGHDFRDYFAPELKRLEDLAQDGLVEWQGHELLVTPIGRILLRHICMCFDAYLHQHENVKYSKVI